MTKSGTNKIHGTLYEYYRPTFTTANDWFNKTVGNTLGQPNIPPFLLRNTFGAAVGGPIKKDRLFYFLSYEGQRKRENSGHTYCAQRAPSPGEHSVSMLAGSNVSRGRN